MATNDLSDITNNLTTSTAEEGQEEEVCNRNDDVTGLDDESVLAESKKISMFCRNCLAPYKGEKGQAGSIILKCEKCFHRDVISEDDLHDTEQSESLVKGGNLMLNRFSEVLLDKNELINIDVDDPSLMNDDFQHMSEVLPHITGIMKSTFSRMHKVTDDYRKVHNAEMLRKLQSEGQGEECQEEDGTKTKQFSVSTYGSEETGDLVIFPEKYKLPEATMKSFKLAGQRGIQEVDKYILSIGIKIGQIGNMPLFQRRLLCYCKYSQNEHLTGKDCNKQEHKLETSGQTSHTDSQSLKTGSDTYVRDITINKQISTLSEETKNIELGQESKIVTKSPQGVPDDNREPSQKLEEHVVRPNIVLPMSAKTHIYDADLDSKIEDITDLNSLSDRIKEVHKEHHANLCQILSDDKPRAKTERSDNSVPNDGKPPSQTGNNDETNTTSVDNPTLDTANGGTEDESVSDDFLFDTDETSKEEEIEDFDKPRGDYLPELSEFPEILSSAEEQKKLSEGIPIDVIILADTEPFSHVEVNEMFNEITTSMITRAAAAKQLRMLKTMTMIKRAARSMAEQVDKVQNQMIKELQIAHRAKQLKAEKQKKQLEETQGMLEHYRLLINHYQETGQVDKMLEILEHLRELNNLN